MPLRCAVERGFGGAGMCHRAVLPRLLLCTFRGLAVCVRATGASFLEVSSTWSEIGCGRGAEEAGLLLGSSPSRPALGPQGSLRRGARRGLRRTSLRSPIPGCAAAPAPAVPRTGCCRGSRCPRSEAGPLGGLGSRRPRPKGTGSSVALSRVTLKGRLFRQHRHTTVPGGPGLSWMPPSARPGTGGILPLAGGDVSHRALGARLLRETLKPGFLHEFQREPGSGAGLRVAGRGPQVAGRWRSHRAGLS